MGDIQAPLTPKHANPAAIKQELARHIGSITPLPEGKRNSIRYKGKWTLLGYGDGAEGAARTILPTLEIAVPFEGVFGRAA